MSRLADILARWLWAYSLWLIRRPWMKRLQRSALSLVPEGRRAASTEGIRRQNRFARRYGKRILSFAIACMLASLMLTFTFQLALLLLDSGVLTMPDEIRQRVGVQEGL
jgi:hypothetical protein